MHPDHDAAFIIELLNSPGFLKNIGDRGVRDRLGAQGYIEKSMQSYLDYGFGLYTVEILETKSPIGICGLVQREHLPDADFGFAFLPQYNQKGYAFEAAQAVLTYSREVLGLKKLLAIVQPLNQNSIRLLNKLSFLYERSIQIRAEEAELSLYSRDLFL